MNRDAGQVISVELYINTGSVDLELAGFQSGSDISGADLFLHGDGEIRSAAGDQLTIHLFQSTPQTGYVTTASYVNIERLGD